LLIIKEIFTQDFILSSIQRGLLGKNSIKEVAQNRLFFIVLGVPKNAVESSNANNCKASGFYSLVGSATNNPFGTGCIMLVYAGYGIAQLVANVDTCKLKFRTSADGNTWSSWVSIIQ